MAFSSAARTAFLAGLAAPMGLFAPIPRYMAYVGEYSSPGNFSIVGIGLHQSIAEVNDGQRPSADAAGRAEKATEPA